MTSILQESSRTNEVMSWPLFSVLTLTVFLILQIAFISEPAPMPDPDEIKHVDGKLLRTALIRNRNTFDAEILIRSRDGDILIYVPSAATVPGAFKFIDKNSILSIDYYPITSGGISMSRAWRIASDGKLLADYYHSTLSKNQRREFDIRFIVLTAMSWVGLLLFLLIFRWGNTAAAHDSR
jgi:hypothetical protein